MFGGEKTPVATGAREKQRRAQMMHGAKKGGGRDNDAILARRGGERESSIVVSILIIFGIACALSWLLTATLWAHGGSPIGVGINSFDRAVMFTSSPNFMGDATTDYILLIMIRGLVMFLAAAIVPAVSFVWTRLLDSTDMNPYLTVWGVSLAVIMLGIGFVQYVMPVISEAIK